MAVKFVAPQVPKPYRVIILGAATQGWCDASQEERNEKIIPRMMQMFAEWKELGAKCIATHDDDLFMVGEPGSPQFMWYLIFEVPSLEALSAMFQAMRETVDGVHLDKYFRLEGRLGRPFFPLEQAMSD